MELASTLFTFHLPVKYHACMAQYCLYHHFFNNASIFFFIVSRRRLHCFIGDRETFNLLLKEVKLDGARKQSLVDLVQQ